MKTIPPITEIMEDKSLNNTQRTCLLKQNFKFEGVPKKKQTRIIEILGYCKELYLL